GPSMGLTPRWRSGPALRAVQIRSGRICRHRRQEPEVNIGAADGPKGADQGWSAYTRNGFGPLSARYAKSAPASRCVAPVGAREGLFGPSMGLTPRWRSGPALRAVQIRSGRICRTLW